ncbi:MAG TPA: type II toxin-antitoxin system prevent-host-death family antitoxin [Allosphingosinicella sp.]|jgi:prevent-host-death family protein
MTIHVNIGEAKTRLSQLVAAALRGEEVVLQKAGLPQVRLVPVADASRAEREAIARRRVESIGFARGEIAAEGPTPEDIRAERLYSPWRRRAHGLDP